MSMYSNFPYQNITRDYEKAQGVTHPTDLSYQIPRDVNIRYITIQNSSTRPIAFAITSYLSGPTPPILSTLVAGEIKHLGVNSHGGPPQNIWILDPQTALPVGSPTCIRSDANDLVLRDGVNKWWVNFFKRPSFAAAK